MAKNGGCWWLIFLGFAMVAALVAMYVFEVAIEAPEGLERLLPFLCLGLVGKKPVVRLCEVCLRNPAGDDGRCAHCATREQKREHNHKLRKQNRRLDLE